MLPASFACLLLGGMVAADVAPAPRPAPRPALVLVEEVVGGSGAVDTRRVLRVGVGRDGKLLAGETIWEGDQRFLGHFGGHRLVGDRHLVTHFGGVIDLRDKKVIHDEQNGDLLAVDGTTALFRVTNVRREEGVFAFDIATGKVNKVADLGKGKFALPGVMSPDGTAAAYSGPVADELFLYQVGSERKSLGKGFHIDVSPLSSTFGPSPVAWLNNGVFLTQRGNGKLVTADVTGKVAELVTIKDAPKEVVSAPYFFRDGSNRLIYVCGGAAFAVDPDKKTAAKYEWRDLGHGFEASWAAEERLHTFRLNGKKIGTFNAMPHTAKTAPGLLAVEARVKGDDIGPPDWVAVWTTASGEWQSLKLWPNSLVGWVK